MKLSVLKNLIEAKIIRFPTERTVAAREKSGKWNDLTDGHFIDKYFGIFDMTEGEEYLYLGLSLGDEADYEFEKTLRELAEKYNGQEMGAGFGMGGRDVSYEFEGLKASEALRNAKMFLKEVLTLRMVKALNNKTNEYEYPKLKLPNIKPKTVTPRSQA